MAIYTNSVPSRGTDYSFPNPQSTGLIGDYEAYSSISLESIELGNADVTKKKKITTALPVFFCIVSVSHCYLKECWIKYRNL